MNEVTLHYDHAKRQIFDHEGRAVSVDEARAFFNTGAIFDCNIAFNTLREHEYNMDAVDAYYKAMDSYS